MIPGAIRFVNARVIPVDAQKAEKWLHIHEITESALINMRGRSYLILRGD